MKNTLFILGSSPYINTISDKIYELQQKYDFLGLNCATLFYPNVKYWMWLDCRFYDEEKFLPFCNNGTKLLTTTEVARTEMKDSCLKPYFEFRLVDDKNILEDKDNINNLLFFKTVVHPAIHFAILQKYDNVILLGIDLKPDWKRFYVDDIVRSEARCQKTREYLYYFKKYIKIYTTDVNNDLDVDYMDLVAL